MMQMRHTNLSRFVLYLIFVAFIQCNSKKSFLVLEDEFLGVSIEILIENERLVLQQSTFSDNSTHKEMSYSIRETKSGNELLITYNLMASDFCLNERISKSFGEQKCEELIMLDVRDSMCNVRSEWVDGFLIYWVEGNYNVIGITCINGYIVRFDCSRIAYDALLNSKKLRITHSGVQSATVLKTD